MGSVARAFSHAGLDNLWAPSTYIPASPISPVYASRHLDLSVAQVPRPSMEWQWV